MKSLDKVQEQLIQEFPSHFVIAVAYDPETHKMHWTMNGSAEVTVNILKAVIDQLVKAPIPDDASRH